MSKTTAQYGDFRIERSFDAPVSELYKMFADKESKELWFKGPAAQATNHEMDFRVGGQETNTGKFHDGVTHLFKGTYYDIVPEKRIVYAYEMYLDGKRISVSIATLEFEDQGEQSKLVLTESGVFLDALDKPSTRERGTHYLLGLIDKALKEGRG